jgi:hypothetical protein
MFWYTVLLFCHWKWKINKSNTIFLKYNLRYFFGHNSENFSFFFLSPFFHLTLFSYLQLIQSLNGSIRTNSTSSSTTTINYQPSLFFFLFYDDSILPTNSTIQDHEMIQQPDNSNNDHSTTKGPNLFYHQTWPSLTLHILLFLHFIIIITGTWRLYHYTRFITWLGNNIIHNTHMASKKPGSYVGYISLLVNPSWSHHVHHLTIRQTSQQTHVPIL